MLSAEEIASNMAMSAFTMTEVAEATTETVSFALGSLNHELMVKSG